MPLTRADLDAIRRRRSYRAAIWILRLFILIALFTAFGGFTSALIPTPVLLLEVVVLIAIRIAVRVLLRRAGMRSSSEFDPEVRVRRVVYRDLFRLTMPSEHHVANRQDL